MRDSFFIQIRRHNEFTGTDWSIAFTEQSFFHRKEQTAREAAHGGKEKDFGSIGVRQFINKIPYEVIGREVGRSHADTDGMIKVNFGRIASFHAVHFHFAGIIEEGIFNFLSSEEGISCAGEVIDINVFTFH